MDDMATISENLQTIKNSTLAMKQAIINKGGTINGDITTWANSITNISSGGENPIMVEKDVNFYDYDGTVLYAYTKDEFLTLSDLPPLPTQPGLICQEWNWDYVDAVSAVSEYGKLDVGASYTTDDGKTRLYIRIAAEGRMTVPLYFSQTASNGVTIDWGDDSATQTLSDTGEVKTSHTYANIGDYCITLTVASGCTLELGGLNSSYGIMGYNIAHNTMLQKVEMGKNVQFSSGTFVYCYCLETITFDISNTYTSGDINCLSFYDDMLSLSTLIIPKGVQYVSSYNSGCFPNLSKIVLPKSIWMSGGSGYRGFLYNTRIKSIIMLSNYLQDGHFESCELLQTVILLNSLTGSISEGAFEGCLSLSSIIIPSGITSIENNAFSRCCSLSSIVIPSMVTSIGSNAFYGCSGMAFYDFSNHTAVPTLSNTNAFTSIPSDCKIIVPDSLYDTWIAATNWSTYASYIIKKSDWDAL